jgi:Cucumopine synthase C-terminal helical bundle domain
MRLVEIDWVPLGIKVTAELSEGPNRNLSDLFWRQLPYNSLQNHALVSGHHLYHLVPSVELLYTQAERKEDRTKSPDGTLFLSQLQHLAIKYGPLSEYIPAAPVGSVVPEHIPLLRQAGRACWEATFQTKEIIEVRVRRKGRTETAFPLPKFECAGSPEVQSLLRKIQDETDRVWIKAPREIVEMHRGNIPSGAGSYDQYFSTLVFLNGETRPLGYCALNGLVRLSRSENLSLDALREITPTFIRTPAEFLGYCGLDALWSLTQETLDILSQLKSKDEFCALIGALALYANVLNTWNLQYFPWSHGDEYPARTETQWRSSIPKQ